MIGWIRNRIILAIAKRRIVKLLCDLERPVPVPSARIVKESR